MFHAILTETWEDYKARGSLSQFPYSWGGYWEGKKFVLFGPSHLTVVPKLPYKSLNTKPLQRQPTEGLLVYRGLWKIPAKTSFIPFICLSWSFKESLTTKLDMQRKMNQQQWTENNKSIREIGVCFPVWANITLSLPSFSGWSIAGRTRHSNTSRYLEWLRSCD